MAEKAQQEPTMEEILSSIRKIISDDGPAQDTPSAGEAPAEPAGFQMRDEDAGDLDDLSFDDEDTFEPTLPENESDMLDALTAEAEVTAADVFEAIEEPSLEAFDELPPLDDLSSFDVQEPQDEGVVEAHAFEAPEPEPQPEPMTFEIEAPEPEPVEIPSFAEEPAPMASSSLTDDKIADAAAGSLSKLLSKVEFGEEAGGNNTIEGLVREMLRPMLKEWLDENLSGIVDRHVEAEVKRISRRAG
ncbi:DUF2497 domain-containing protein [Hyphomonas sp. FCG-A18]|uniref:DUF2497 domain-containing protein n=1 Tax=Hyphomonas sp. FCG-A18 TaxID=3080019 RepID=UPI002B2847DF|nr:DUF2497 domain-containing protein [Hyphomonas sp. FCG-A18]